MISLHCTDLLNFALDITEEILSYEKLPEEDFVPQSVLQNKEI